ncbi:hypothetical protein [Enterococcus faecium]|uniref:hypothetical protein n=1 Tax=Enterococcus faecium TaxID=1352 RepID=UPI0019119259|nr:hypothetical protein [Enterococcus faecium]MBK5028639.1 hypothetical protein [Enterococcus faecium]MBK5039349.1 hypothetical protein [Enterococcus faecium]MBK5044468.1 hypothetical protein [Enterococcus faecium]MBK5069267.1 hypothetical protein [Enterococcus faecium]MBK5132441.1 hypothetical protein [Enterococcus faecium]
MSELVKEIERQLGYDMLEEGNMTAYDVLEIVKNFKQPQLDDNQQIVLQWLKLTAPAGKPMQVVFWMMNNAAWGHLDELRDPLMELTDKQQFEVLAAFAQWGLEQEENHNGIN